MPEEKKRTRTVKPETSITDAEHDKLLKLRQGAFKMRSAGSFMGQRAIRVSFYALVDK